MSPQTNKDMLGGVALLAAALAALLFVNLGGAAIYNEALLYKLKFGFGQLALEKSIHHWINDGLMVLFFLLIGIEINREVRTGNLSTPKQALLPAVAAIGGFAVPAIVYSLFASSNSSIAGGWSIPTATDIAFAVALLSVFKSRVSASLRIFLLALAVTDDLMAILVIAIFYTTDVVWMNLFLAGAGSLLFVAQRKFGVQNMWFYLIVGLVIWLAVLKSGVHATIAGVIIGLLLPLNGVNGRDAPAEIVEHALQPYVRWFVLPLFAFANVGIDLRMLGWDTFFGQLTWSIVLALVIGKQIGVFGSVWLIDKLGIAKPAGSTWRQVYGVSCICGIGFTMSLFIGTLALPQALQPEVRLGVILGSSISALLAIAVLAQGRAVK